LRNVFLMSPRINAAFRFTSGRDTISMESLNGLTRELISSFGIFMVYTAFLKGRVRFLQLKGTMNVGIYTSDNGQAAVIGPDILSEGIFAESKLPLYP
jgi:hypothetical protein